MTFAEKLKELRAQAGLTQIQLAEASGSSLGAVRDYEQGNRIPLLPAATKLARALGVDCTAFADCEDVDAEPAPKKPARRKK